MPQLSPSRWVGDLVRNRALDRELVVGLAAGLLRSSHPGVVCEGARLAIIAEHPGLSEMIKMVLDTSDVGLLLSMDPYKDRSVEDTLNLVWLEVADAGDPVTRQHLLAGLRNAGLAAHELRTLVISGTGAEIRLWLPGLVKDGIPSGAATALAGAMTRGPDIREALMESLDELPSADKKLMGDLFSD